MQMRKKLSLIVLILTISVPRQTLANCQTTLDLCDKAVESCKVALEAKKEEIKLCRLGLSQALDNDQHLRMELEDKEKQLGSWYRNPFTMGTVGVIIGIVVTGYALRGSK
jgi:hypothetical protein